MNFLSVDIEISDIFQLGPNEDIEKYAPLHVCIASTAVYGGEERLWYSVEAENKPILNMTQSKAHSLLQYLEDMQGKGYMVCSWNGLKFDFQWIGYMAQDMKYAARIAKNSYDLMFQFFNQKGFPVGLEAVGKAMGIKQKKIMKGADAPKEWRAGNYNLVQEYVLNDSRITNDIILAVMKQKKISWITKSGQQKSEVIHRLKMVREILNDPEPDQSWMDKPLPRRTFYQWFPD